MAPDKNKKLNSFADLPHDNSDATTRFSKAADRIVRIDVDGIVYIQLGAALARSGDIKFKRLPPLKEKGISQKALGLFRPLVTAEGKGQLYIARQARRVKVIKLTGQSVNVSAEALLAFESSLDFQLFVIGKGVIVMLGGVLGVKLSGTGSFAIAAQGDAMVIPVTPGNDLWTDPHATIAWTEGLEPKLAVDLEWRDLLGKGSEESIQLQFAGNGEVVIQPGEDKEKFGMKKTLKSLL